ncbi:MAG: cyclic pyranopterin monophosphate synthase MoaC [Phycisphaerae bacterium]|jgi:cyclic pyranopterin phosphate synthase
MDRLSHVDDQGRAFMVDVSGKTPQRRTATAAGRIDLAQATARLIAENNVKKGDVLGVAELAGLQAAKRTSELIPLCHPLQLGQVQVRARLVEDGVEVGATVTCVDRTGAEMEALTAVSVALLTIYDMCKAVDKRMSIRQVVLEEKRKDDI